MSASEDAPAAEPIAAVTSSGNVFSDLGLPDADRLLAEADALIASYDCACTAGTVCRHNNACPRLAPPDADR